jgi:hypothetical protein
LAGGYSEGVAARLREQGLSAQTATVEGKLYVEIIRFAEGNSIGLIVMSTRGHSGLSRWLLAAFSGLILLGDLVKLVFLRIHYFSVRDTPKAMLYGLTSVYVVGYLVILLLELMR